MALPLLSVLLPEQLSSEARSNVFPHDRMAILATAWDFSFLCFPQSLQVVTPCCLVLWSAAECGVCVYCNAPRLLASARPEELRLVIARSVQTKFLSAWLSTVLAPLEAIVAVSVAEDELTQFRAQWERGRRGKIRR